MVKAVVKEEVKAAAREEVKAVAREVRAEVKVVVRVAVKEAAKAALTTFMPNNNKLFRCKAEVKAVDKAEAKEAARAEVRAEAKEAARVEVKVAVKEAPKAVLTTFTPNNNRVCKCKLASKVHNTKPMHKVVREDSNKVVTNKEVSKVDNRVVNKPS